MGIWVNSIDTFLDSTVASDDPPAPAEYVRGTQRINFYAEHFDREDRVVIDDEVSEYPDYESALFSRLHTPHSSPLIIIGGIGSGKSSSIQHVTRLIASQGRQAPAATPVILDAISYDRGNNIDHVFRHLYRSICNSSLTQLALRAHGDAVQLNRIGHRTLLLCNDIYRWCIHDEQNLEFPFHPNVPADNRVHYLTDPDAVIVATKLDPNSDFVASVRNIRRGLPLDQCHALSQCILAFLAEHSKDQPVTARCIVVDNVDQLATDDIQRLFSRLRQLKSEIPTVEIIVPLRPSSIASRGYTRNTTYMYHYGPNCFDMMLGRCIRHILSRPEDEIRSKAFARPPTDDDLTLLMVSAHIYANLLVAGASSSTASTLAQYHDDHKWLASLVVLTDDRGMMVKQILNALIGTSARYAIRHASRFFHRAEQNKKTLLKYAQSVRAATQRGADSRLVKLRFGDIVDAALAITSRTGTNEEHCINIFKPLRHGPNREWPSLAMLRVLFLLLEQRERALAISEIVAILARHGIPGEITLLAIDHLRVEDRHLCWISSNKDSPLELCANDLCLHVMISEQGAEYARSLSSNFEYTWLCGRNLQPPNNKRETFLSRLDAYGLLVGRLLDIEWKQVVFFLTARDRLTMPHKRGNSGYLVSLRIALKTASEAMEAVVKSASRRSERLFRNEQPLEAYLRELDPILVSMLESIARATLRHVMSFGRYGFRTVYSVELEDYTAASQLFRKSPIFEALNARRLLDEINAFISSLPAIGSREDEDMAAPVQLGRPPKEDTLSRAAEALNSLPSVLGGGIGRNAGLAILVDIEKGLYESAEGNLRAILEGRFPVFIEVQDGIAKLRRHAAAVVASSCRRGVEIQTASFRWYREAEERWRDFETELKELAYTVDPNRHSLHEITEAKRRCNRILAIYLELARFVGITQDEHYNVHWTEAV